MLLVGVCCVLSPLVTSHCVKSMTLFQRLFNCTNVLFVMFYETLQKSRSNKNHSYFYIGIFIMVCFSTLISCSNRSAPAPVSTLYTSIGVSERNKDSINSTYYIVKPGDTLFSIAWRANSDVKRIANLNKLSKPYKIYPKQKLFLVKSSTSKMAPASKNKELHSSDSKTSTRSNKNRSKNTLASSKKQAYGENVTKNETVQKPLPKSNFSKKIKRWQWPVKGKIIEHFSNRTQGNKGIDIAGQRGTKIRASAKGKVVYAGNALRGYGKLIIIKHNDDYLSAYAHNDTILVKEQQLINMGDTIATMGDTEASRVMLHFEIRYRGKSVNPEKYLPKK